MLEITLNTLLIAIIAVILPLYWLSLLTGRVIYKIALYGVIYPILVIVVIAAYLGIELVDLVPVTAWEK